MISRIEAFKYRCFDRIDIKVGQYNVLIGANGTGKSTLLDIPLLLGEILSKGLVPAFLESPSIAGSPRARSLQDLIYYHQGDYFGFAIEANLPQEVISNLLKYESHRMLQDKNLHPQRVRYEIKFQIFNNIEIHVREEFLYIVPPENYEPKQPFNWQQIIKRKLENKAIVTPEKSIGDRIDLELEPQELALANLPRDFWNFPVALWFKNLLEKGVMRYEPSWSMLRLPCPPGQPQTLRSDAANLPWLVLSLQRKQPDLFASWVEHLKMAFPNLLAIEAVQREEDYHAYLQLKYSGEHIVTSSELSDGTLRILALTILPYLPQKPSLILLEEADNRIHPRAIEVVLQSLSSVYDSQVLMSTYSPVVLAHTDLESVIIMRKNKENGVEAIQGNQHPRLQDWRGGIDLGSLFAAGVLG